LYSNGNNDSFGFIWSPTQIKTVGGKTSNLFNLVLLDEKISILFLYFIVLVILYYIL